MNCGFAGALNILEFSVHVVWARMLPNRRRFCSCKPHFTPQLWHNKLKQRKTVGKFYTTSDVCCGVNPVIGLSVHSCIKVRTEKKGLVFFSLLTPSTTLIPLECCGFHVKFIFLFWIEWMVRDASYATSGLSWEEWKPGALWLFLVPTAKTPVSLQRSTCGIPSCTKHEEFFLLQIKQVSK